LDNYNKVRLQLLKDAEAQLSAGDGNDLLFRYYSVLFEHKERSKIVPNWISYMNLINTFAKTFMSLVIASLLYKLLMSALAGNRFASILLAVTIVAVVFFVFRMIAKSMPDYAKESHGSTGQVAEK